MKRVKLKRRFEFRTRDPRRLVERIDGKRRAAPDIAAGKNTKPTPHLVHDTEQCDPIVEKLFENIALARELERVSWSRLARYLERTG